MSAQETLLFYPQDFGPWLGEGVGKRSYLDLTWCYKCGEMGKGSYTYQNGTVSGLAEIVVNDMVKYCTSALLTTKLVQRV